MRVELVSHDQCTGCTACASVCGVGAIRMAPDDTGFLFPVVDDTSKCVGCLKCQQVCPIRHENSADPSPKTFVAQNVDAHVRMNSTSGGVFSALGEIVLSAGGVIYGCTLTSDRLEARHIRVDTSRNLFKLRGSKYVQSDLSGIFVAVRRDLKNGKSVLFSGTPCQVSGLRMFLSERLRDKLFLVEVACHGVMSPKVFDAYKKELTEKAHSKIVALAFRDKMTHPGRSSFVVKFENPKKDICVPMYTDTYGRLFQSRIALRRSCMNCRARNGRSGADITIGDFWGIEQHHSDLAKLGDMSVVIVHTNVGMHLVSRSGLNIWDSEFSKASDFNTSLVRNGVRDEKETERFYKLYRDIGFNKAVVKMLDGPLYVRTLRGAVAFGLRIYRGLMRRIRHWVKLVGEMLVS